MKPLNLLLATTFLSNSLSAYAEVCPSEFMATHPIVTAVTRVEVEKECKQNYREIAAVLEEQDNSEEKRIEFALNAAKSPTHNDPILNGFHKAGAAGGALALASYGYSRRLSSQYRNKMIEYFSSFTDEGKESVAADLQRMALKDRDYDKVFAKAYHAKKKGIAPEVLKELQEKEKAVMAEFYSNKKSAARYTLSEELMKLQKIEVNKVVPSSISVSPLARETFEREFATNAVKRKELDLLIDAGTKLGKKKFIPRLFTILGIEAVALDAAVMALSSSREAPELLWAEAVHKNPALLLDPSSLEDSGILQSQEKGDSQEVNCLALKRHKPLMLAAAKKLADQMEASFQAKMMLMIYPDKVMKGLEDKKVAVDNTTVRRPSYVPEQKQVSNKAEIPEWLKRK